MKIKALVSVSALFLLCLATSLLASAQTGEQSATGKFQFSLADGYTKYVEFDVKKQADGSTQGTAFLSDEAPIYEQDVDGTGDPALKEKYPGFYVKVDFDGLTVDKNQAVMSGTVTDSSIRSFVGQRVLLTVEDNGDNTRVPDNLTWGIYPPYEKPKEPPTDAERKEDEGAGTTWTTSDAERKDDVEVVYPKDPTITSQSFELPAYAFVEVARGAGDIQVNP